MTSPPLPKVPHLSNNDKRKSCFEILDNNQIFQCFEMPLGQSSEF